MPTLDVNRDTAEPCLDPFIHPSGAAHINVCYRHQVPLLESPFMYIHKRSSIAYPTSDNEKLIALEKRFDPGLGIRSEYVYGRQSGIQNIAPS